MALQIKVTGTEKLEAFAQKMKGFPEILVPILRKTSNRVAILIQGESRKNAPVDTGRLRNSIQTSLGINNFIGATVQSDLEYSEYVHEGTRPHIVPIQELRGWAQRKGLDPFQVQSGIAKKGTQAQPFMRDAVEQNERRITDIFDNAIEKSLEQLRP